jgi:DNA-binding CsgD family transcriptional regulator
MRINKRVWVSATLLFLILMVSAQCTKRKSEIITEDSSSQLMSELGQHYANGDSLKILETRRKIQDEIAQDKSVKLELYLQTFDANILLQHGNLAEAEQEFERILQRARKENIIFTQTSVLSSLGQISYFKGNYFKALNYWSEGIKIGESNGIQENTAAMLSNKGAAYMGLGYYSMAAYHFIQSKSLMEKQKNKDENYWICHINIANAYAQLNRLDKALSILKKTNTSFSSTVKYLYYSNMASVYQQKGDTINTLDYLDSCKIFSSYNESYSTTLLEQEMRVYMQFNQKERLNTIVDTLFLQYPSQHFMVQLVFYQANVFLKKDMRRYFSAILALEKELEPNDYILSEDYYKLLADVYHLMGHKQAEIEALRKLNFFQGKLVDEKLTTQLEDYELLEKYEEINTENKLLEVTNLSSKEQISKQRQIQLFLIIALVLLLLLVVSLFLSRRKSNLLKQKEMELSTLESISLQERLEDAQRNSKLLQRLFYKTSLLKKQLDDFFNTFNWTYHSDEALQEVMKAKSNIRSFYQLHYDVIVNNLINDEISAKMERIKQIMPSLNEKELKVIEYVFQEFSTSEIAILMGKSIKNIEFIRSNIRKKFAIDSSQDLNTFIQKLDI